MANQDYFKITGTLTPLYPEMYQDHITFVFMMNVIVTGFTLNATHDYLGQTMCLL